MGKETKVENKEWVSISKDQYDELLENLVGIGSELDALRTDIFDCLGELSDRINDEIENLDPDDEEVEAEEELEGYPTIDLWDEAEETARDRLKTYSQYAELMRGLMKKTERNHRPMARIMEVMDGWNGSFHLKVKQKAGYYVLQVTLLSGFGRSRSKSEYSFQGKDLEECELKACSVIMGALDKLKEQQERKKEAEDE